MSTSIPRALAAAALGATAALLLSACGSTHDGALLDSSQEIAVGTSEYEAQDVAVTCKGRHHNKTALIETPDGWSASTEQPRGGEGPTGASIASPEGTEYALSAGGDDAVSWTEDDQFTMTFEIDEQLNGQEITFYVAGVSCAT